MSQQINLFNPIFRKKGFSFTSAVAMAYGVALAAAVGAMGAVYAHYDLREASAQALAVEQAHKATVARFEKLTAEAGQQKPNAQLEADIARLDLQLKGRQEVIDTLKSGVVGNISGFSDYMRAFSRQSVSGLWLTGFDIARGGDDLAIQGRTLNADLVAIYLKQLNQEKSLQGRQFAALRIGQPPPVTEQTRGAAESKAESSAQGQKDAKEQKSAPPRYLEFAISTGDLAEPAGRSAPSSPRRLGALDLDSALDNTKAATRREVSR